MGVGPLCSRNSPINLELRFILHFAGEVLEGDAQPHRLLGSSELQIVMQQLCKSLIRLVNHPSVIGPRPKPAEGNVLPNALRICTSTQACAAARVLQLTKIA